MLAPARLARVAAVITIVAAVATATSAHALDGYQVTDGGWQNAGPPGISAATGQWTFTIDSVSGKPAQIIIDLVARDPVTHNVTAQYFAGDAGLKPGETFTTYNSHVPPGFYDVDARLWGGPPGSQQVTFSVTSP